MGLGKGGKPAQRWGKRKNNKTAAAAAVVTDEGLFKTETRVTGFHSVPMTCEIVGNDKQANTISSRVQMRGNLSRKLLGNVKMCDWEKEQVKCFFTEKTHQLSKQHSVTGF